MENYDLNKLLEKSKSLADLARYFFKKANYYNKLRSKKILEKHGINWEEWLLNKKNKPKKYCKNCGKEIIGGDSRKKFCNISCSSIFNSKKKMKKRYCLHCGKPIKKGMYCNSTCYSIFKNKEYIDLWKKGEKNGIKGKNEIATPIRNYIFEKNNYKCQKCGFNTINPFSGRHILQIHHIDGNCTNNKEENLELLCPNCHALTDNYGRRNKNSTRLDKRLKWVQNLLK